MMKGEYLPAECRRVLSDILWIVSCYEGIVSQLWLHNDCYRYKLQGDKRVLRLGHLNSLLYIEIPTCALLAKEIVITKYWLSLFCKAAATHQKFYRSFLFRN